MNARFPQEASAYAIEGTGAHWVAWEIIAMRAISEGVSTPNGLIVTGEMLDGGELIAEVVEQRIRRGLELHIEEPVRIAQISADCCGTPDLWAYDAARAHIEIIDYKFGHRFVDEYFNLQGISYLLGILAKLVHEGAILGKPEAVSVSFTIVQPRCYHRGSPVRTHSYRVSDIIPYIQKLQEAARLALLPDPAGTVNEHCTDCPGRHTCSALQKAAYSGAEFSMTQQALEISPEAAALELRMMERALQALNARVEGLRELVTANLKAGKSVPFYRLEESRGRLAWNIPNDQIIGIGQIFGKDLSKPGVLTPAQAKKEGIDEAVIKQYTSNPSGSLKLVAINTANVRRVFQGE
jgi:hypothetical protein